MGGAGRQKGYRIGEVAAVAGLSRQTLHSYVRLGLIRPAGRTPGGHRTFTAGVFRRLDEIRVLRRERTLAEIRAQFGGAGAQGRAPGRAG